MRIFKKEKKIETQAPDISIITFTFLMTIFGIIMIYNASAYLAFQEFQNQFHFLILQIIWIVISTIVAIIIYSIDYRKIAKYILPIFLISTLLLTLVLIIGTEINGSKRWFEIGAIRLQPAEFVKPILIIYLATFLTKAENFKEKTNKILKKYAWEKVGTYLFIVGIVAGLIVLEPDLGTTLIVVITSFAMFFLFSTNTYETQNMLKLGLITGIIGSLVAIMASYRLTRIVTYLHLLSTGEVLDPRGAGYQINQILIGIGSGGFWGKGFGQSRQRFGYLVENTAFTDSTFAVILEEFGVISAIVMIGIWIFFFIKGYQISKNAPDQLGKCIAIGITIWLTTQALFNMAANVGIIPITGLPLPFLTYGGSSTLVTFIGIALLLNISKYKKNNSDNLRYGSIR